MILILVLFSSFGFLVCQSSANYSAQNFYKRFEGTIGQKYNIVMNITRKDSQLYGSYYYTKYGQPINFSWYNSIDEKGNFVIEEESIYDDGKSSGIFRGKFINEHTIAGYWKNPSAKDSLKFLLTEKYTNGSVKADMKYISKRPDSLVTISFFYPEFIETKTKDSLNKFINKVLLGKENQTKILPADFEKAMDDYIERYKHEVLEDTLYGDYKPPYSNESSLKIYFNSDSILCLEGFGYQYEGGAHGNYYFSYSNFDLNSGTLITYDDIFISGYEQVLNSVGEKIFREKFKIDPNQSFTEQGWFGFEDGFFVNQNFAICKGGLLMRYDPYEAGAYALGAPSIFIPDKEIKNIIKKKSVLDRIF